MAVIIIVFIDDRFG